MPFVKEVTAIQPLQASMRVFTSLLRLRPAWRRWLARRWMAALASLVPAGALGLWYMRFVLATRESRLLPPVSRASFPLGSLGAWTDLLAVNKAIGRSADESNGLCVQWLGSAKGYAVTKAAHVELALTKSLDRSPNEGKFDPSQPTAAFAIGAGLWHIKMFMGFKTVGVLNGEEWKLARKRMAKHVQNVSHVRAQWDAVNSLANDFMDHVLDPSRPETQEVSSPLFTMAYDILSNAVFGEHANFMRKYSQNGEAEPVVQALKETMHEMTRRMGSVNPLDWVYVFDQWRPSQRRYVECKKMVWDYVKAMVARNRNDPTDCFLTALVKETSDESFIFDNVQTLMWAGHESTAASISFTLFELSSRPDLQERLQVEVEAVVGPTRELKYEHLAQLPLVSAVVDEALRLHPPAIWTNRALQQDAEFDGVTVKKGQLVFIPIRAVHRSPLNWDAPDEFRPERFLNKEAVPGSYIPFGSWASRRICPGFKLAHFELKACLAVFALRGIRLHRQLGDSEPCIRANGAFMLCLDNHLRISSSLAETREHRSVSEVSTCGMMQNKESRSISDCSTVASSTGVVT